MINYVKASLKRQLFVLITIGVLIPLLVVSALLFLRARQQMQNQEIAHVSEDSAQVISGLDETIINVQHVSDKFSIEDDLYPYLRKSYDGDIVDKMHDTRTINNLFSFYDPLQKSARISALYTSTGEILNFLEPENDSPAIRQRLDEMGVAGQENLMQLQWFPLQNNFLVSASSSDPRQSRVVIGSRRMVLGYTGEYLGTQIFAIPEETLYERYKNMVSRTGGHIHIINSKGELLSSSDQELLSTGSFPREVFDRLQQESNVFTIDINGSPHIVSKSSSQLTDWQAVVIVPLSTFTGPIDNLFGSFFILLLLCGALCLFILHLISNRFVRPIKEINSSMEKVEHGNLNAYVDISSPDEVGSMASYYNNMLRRINKYIEDEYEVEKQKKELEMEVLMSQVNPHFLYNTLETLVWKANERGNPDIGRIAASLGRLYRISISDGKVIIKIQQEIDHLVSYINIQRERYAGLFYFDLRVDYKRLRDLCTLKLILQPVVENSFLYAMDDLDHLMGIRLHTVIGDQYIKFVITDNGTGMDKEQLDQVRQHIYSESRPAQKKTRGSGIGLRSINERIRLYLGLPNAVSIYSRKGVGSKVVITIPRIKEEKDPTSEPPAS